MPTIVIRPKKIKANRTNINVVELYFEVAKNLPPEQLNALGISKIKQDTKGVIAAAKRTIDKITDDTCVFR